MKVAIIGGGIFGATAAIHTARAGHETHLFEKLGGLLQAASGINQYRLHRGYHYPRSPETVVSAMNAEASFRKEYGGAVIDDGTNLYAIAREGSAVSADQFLASCDKHGLAWRVVEPDGLVSPEKIECCIEATEAWFDPTILRNLVEDKVRDSGVVVHVNTEARAEDLENFDRIVVATYAHTNSALPGSHAHMREAYQFELCEKPVVTMPSSFGLRGIVVIDGPFMCVDPMGRTGQYVLGNVVHAIHASSVGHAPDIPPEFLPLMNRGVIRNPPKSAFQKFIEHGSAYIPSLREAKHIGSMFTIRTVLPHVEETDARPTIVKKLDDRHIRIFSGKIGNCVEAAQQVLTLL
ncbi:MAG TPA: FAD-dependent oxidoreductase [Candidatus Paceibacterota bacterium]